MRASALFVSEFFTVSAADTFSTYADAQAKASTIFSHLLIEIDIHAGMIPAVRCKAGERGGEAQMMVFAKMSTSRIMST